MDKHHDSAGARVVAGVFPPRAVECVRLHVTAKRYLCAIATDYYDRLSPPFKHSLAL